MTEDVIPIYIAAAVSLLSALASGGVSIWNRKKADTNVRDIQQLKSTVDKELERLRTTLSYRQLINSTQWNAEFTTYQAIWKAIVEVRPLADKLVNREGELDQMGLPEEYLSSEDRLVIRRDLVRQLIDAAKGLLSATYDNTPFYPAPIRSTANQPHQAALSLVNKNLSSIIQAKMGSNTIQTEEFRKECLFISLA